MIYLQCTKRAQTRLGLDENDLGPAEASASKLGTWSLHIIPLVGRLGYLFMNDRSLLSFVIMEGKQRVELADLMLFLEAGVKHVGELLDLPDEPLADLLNDFEEIAISSSPSKSICGHLRSLGSEYAEFAADAVSGRAVDMSSVVAHVNSKPRAKLGYATSREVVRDLLLNASEA